MTFLIRLIPGWLLCAVVASTFASAAAGQQRPFTARDLAGLERVSDPRVSPDGRYVAYTLRTTDWDQNSGVQALWLIDLQGDRTPRRLAASDGGASNPRWSPDNRWIYFLSGRGGSRQVWRTDPSGQSAVPITALPLDVLAFRVSPDGARIAVALAVFPDCGDDEVGCTAARLGSRDAARGTGRLYDRLLYRFWDSWEDGRRNHLFLVSIGALGRPRASAVALTPGFDGDVPTIPFGDDGDFVFTADGSALIFAARRAAGEAWSTNYELWKAAIDAPSAPAKLTVNPASDMAPVVSPDGTRLAYLAMRRPGFGSDRQRVIVRDLRTGAERELAAGWDRSPSQLRWSSDGSRLFALAQDVGQARLFSIDLEGTAVAALTGEGTITAFDVLPKALVYAHDDFGAPAQLFLHETGGAPVALTSHNAQALAGTTFGGFEQFVFPGWNGEPVHAYLVRPAGFDPSRKYPVAFLIHGGPQGSFGNQFHYRWNAQTFAGRGYAVLLIDFHGSIGYGQKFADAVTGHWGDRPLEDLQKGWRHALKRFPFLDPTRACALGGSYGGYMTNWMASQWPEPWRCFVTHAGNFDLRGMVYSSEALGFMEWEFGGMPWSATASHERFNPARFVDKWRVPTLVTYGGKDFRVPEAQSLGAFNALQRKGIPSQLLYFDDENHWILKPRNSVQWHDAVEAWLDRWTAPRRGIEVSAARAGHTRHPGRSIKALQYRSSAQWHDPRPRRPSSADGDGGRRCQIRQC